MCAVMTSKFLEFSKSRGTRIPVRRGGNPIADIAIWPWVSRYEWPIGDSHGFKRCLVFTAVSPERQPAFEGCGWEE